MATALLALAELLLVGTSFVFFYWGFDLPGLADVAPERGWRAKAYLTVLVLVVPAALLLGWPVLSVALLVAALPWPIAWARYLLSPSKRLAHTCHVGDVRGVRRALRHGANPNGVDHHYVDGMSLLRAALMGKKREVVKALLEGGASPNTDSATQPLASAVLGDDAEMARLLLKAGADPDAAYHSSQDFLIARGPGGGMYCYRILDDPADVLGLACSRGSLELVDMLLDAGADPEGAHAKGNATPLMIAAEKGHLQIVERLLRAGADPRREARAMAPQGQHTSAHLTGLSIAEAKGDTQLLTLMRQAFGKDRTEAGATEPQQPPRTQT